MPPEPNLVIFSHVQRLWQEREQGEVRESITFFPSKKGYNCLRVTLLADILQYNSGENSSWFAMFLLVRLLVLTCKFCDVSLSCLVVGWLGFLPEVLGGDSPDLQNVIAGPYKHYGQAFLSSLKVRAISSFVLMYWEGNGEFFALLAWSGLSRFLPEFFFF